MVARSNPSRSIRMQGDRTAHDVSVEIEAINRSARAMAKRLGLVFVPDQAKIRVLQRRIRGVA
jgi:hypothetical protein